MGNLGNFDSASSLTKLKSINQTPANPTTALRKDSKELNALESLIDDLRLNDLKHDCLKLNHEAILTILKIKKQNKASLFNLILPPALPIESVEHSQANSPALKTINTTFMSSTPWLVKEKLPVAVKIRKKETSENEDDDKKQESDSSLSSVTSSIDDDVNMLDDNEESGGIAVLKINEGKTVEENDSDEVLANRNEEEEEVDEKESEFDYNEGCKR